jgi:nucleotide-binding universal stress UspA family protein
MGKIVVGMDGSVSSHHALRWAAEQAQRTGASLQVVMTWYDPYAGMWKPHDPSAADPLALTRRAVERHTRQVLGENPGVPVEAVALEGPPAKVLLEQSRDADLLVLGKRGMGAFVELMLGSVSLHCVTHATCPVVVVH